MSTIRVMVIGLLAFIFMIIGCGGNTSDETATAETETIATAETLEEELLLTMDDVLARIEKGEVKEMFVRYTPPEDLKRLQENNQLDGAVSRFDIFKQQFIEAIKTAKTAEPQFNEDSTKVYYEVAEVPGGKVVFQKLDGKWYFSD